MAATRDKRKEEIADHFRVHWRTVLQWVKAGLPCARHSKHRAYVFNVKEVDEWLDEQGRSTRPGRPTSGGGTTEDLRKAQLQLTIERALLTRQRREREAGRLHDTIVCRARRQRQIQAVKAALMAVPRSLAVALEHKERRQIESLLDERLRGIADRFASEA